MTFRCASENIKIAPEILNNESLGDAATEFEDLNYYDPVAPVLTGVREESSARFKVETIKADAAQVRPMVKVGESVVEADDEGYYTVGVTDSDVIVDVFTVPVDGARLTPVSALKEPLPEGAMAGKETLVTVILPEASAIEANTFEGCVNLTNVVVPECVNIIGANAFQGCSSLRNLSFSGITGVGANAFNGCEGMTSIIFTAARPGPRPPGFRRPQSQLRGISRRGCHYPRNCRCELREGAPGCLFRVRPRL